LVNLRHQPLVSVVVLNYNGLTFIDKCLNSVLNNNYSDFELLLVDNASTDGSLEYVKEKFGHNTRIKIIANDRNYGFAEGNNIGLRYVKGEFVVFLNMDTEVDSSWLEQLVKVMESNPTIGAAQSKLLLMDNPKQFDTCGHMLTPFGFTIERGLGEEDNGQYDYVADIFGGKGASLIVRRSVIKEVGSFDRDFFTLMEETDLCCRIWLRGYRVVFVPKSVVYHAVAAARLSAKNWRRVELFYWHRNQLMTLIKNLGLKSLVKIMPIHLTLSFGNALLGSVNSRDVHPLKSLISAHVWILMNFKHIWMKRIQVQFLVRRKNDDEIMPHIMVKTTILGKPTH
jgi:GT2 family glycosyltransferase